MICPSAEGLFGQQARKSQVATKARLGALSRILR
jgi:hypothetical protein